MNRELWKTLREAAVDFCRRSLMKFSKDDFMFELTKKEQDSLRSQFVTLKRGDTIHYSSFGPRFSILKKLYELVGNERNGNLNAEMKRLIAVVENQRLETMAKLNGFLKGLGYLEVQS